MSTILDEDRIITSDCISYLKGVESEHFDLTIADPPYYRICGDFDFQWKNTEEYLDWCKLWIAEVHRTLKVTGSFYLWGKIGFGNGYPLFKLCDWIESNKLFSVRNWITQRNTRGRGNKRGFMEAREELVFMTKTDAYTWNTVYTNEPSNRKDLGFDGRPRKNKFKRCSDVWIDIAEASQSANQRFKLSDGSAFPTVKAQSLCERIILASSNEKDDVYIPFGGSGSEAVACTKLNRDWVLTEINPRYVDEVISPRLSTIEDKKYGR